MAKRAKRAASQTLIFDTDVLIWYFRGNAKALNLIEGTNFEHRCLSSISLMELLQGCRSQAELRDVQAFVAANISRLLHPKTSISEKAIHLIDQFALSHGLRVMDALIGSTAFLDCATLVTGNVRHFHFIPGLELRHFVPS